MFYSKNCNLRLQSDFYVLISNGHLWRILALQNASISLISVPESATLFLTVFC